jgi:hypothetical protein
MKKKKIYFWCRVFGHNYGYITDGKFEYRQCKRCNDAFEVLKSILKRSE